MNWLHEISYFFGGVFVINGLPHFVSGVMGRAFQTPFAKPPGVGLSSSRMNVLWGWFNFAIAYALVCRVGNFHLRDSGAAVAFGLGMLSMAMFAAQIFGKLHGGEALEAS